MSLNRTLANIGIALTAFACGLSAGMEKWVVFFLLLFAVVLMVVISDWE